MGQRSQIYVRYTDENNKVYLVARYFPWNFGERMISRCRHTLDWIQEHIKYKHYFTNEIEKLCRIIDVNFDMHDVVISSDIIDEYFKENFDDDISFNDYVFEMQPNNDGKLFIDIKDDVIKYAFLDYGCTVDKIMDAEKYMEWNWQGWRTSDSLDEDEKKTCEDNIKEINKIATLMTEDENVDFINYDYVSDESITKKYFCNLT